MTAAAVLIDGVARDAIAVTDRGLAFGDGVFRTLAVRSGRPLNWRWQWRRLAADCGTLELPTPSEATLLDEIRRVAPGEATVKVLVTRGPATRGYAIPASAKPSRIVMAFPPASHAPERQEEGVRVRRCQLALSQQPRLAGAKTLNRLENVLARSEWSDAAIAEGLLGDSEGRLVGGTMSNIFLVRGGSVATPALERAGVVGAQRERVREILAIRGIECAVRDLTWDDLSAADEVFITNSLIGAWPVSAFEARRWGVGEITRRVQDWIAEDDARA